MSVLDKLLDAVKLNDDYDEDDYLDDDLLDSDDDDFLDDDQEDKPVKKFFQKFSKKSDDEEVDDFDDEEPVAAAPKQPVKTVSIPKVSVKQDKPARSTSSKITPMRSSRKGSQAANMEVCVIRPTSMEDTREIADTLVDNSTVVLKDLIWNLHRGLSILHPVHVILWVEACRRYPAISSFLDLTMWILLVIFRIFLEVIRYRL